MERIVNPFLQSSFFFQLLNAKNELTEKDSEIQKLQTQLNGLQEKLLEADKKLAENVSCL